MKLATFIQYYAYTQYIIENVLMRISSIFVLASRLKEDTEESKRHRKKADSVEGFEIILFWAILLRAGVKNVIFLSTKDVKFSRDRSREITSFTGIIIKFKSPCRKVNLE